MAQIIGLQTSKTQNNLRIVYLILLFPVFLFFTLWLFFSLFTQKWTESCNINWECVKHYTYKYCTKRNSDWNCTTYETELKFSDWYTQSDYDKVISSQIVSETDYYISKSPFEYAIYTFWWALPILILWLLVWIYNQKRIIFSFTGAKELTRTRCPEIYNIVENLAISRGLPVPKIWIIEDDSMNAFATGWSTKDSWIVFSSGLLHKLNKQEIEAVAAHEMTHIINKDVKVMVIINVFIGAIWTIGYILMRSSSTKSSGNKKWWNPLLILWLMLYILSIVILPFINLAISRKKEYLADAWSVELTKDKNAMISALKKISTDARIEAIDKNSSTVTAMFISNPKRKTSLFSELLSTHPPIEKRIKMLEMY